MITVIKPLRKTKYSKLFHYINNEELNRFFSESIDYKPGLNNGLRFSIVIPSYNQANFLELCLKSIINQKYGNVEIIVIDGGSTDTTVKVIRKYERFITYWESVPDKGQSDALNKGFQKATGDIYGWMNSDDIYTPGAFNEVSEVFRENKDVDIIYGDLITIDEKNILLAYHHAIPYSKYHLLYEGFTMNAQAMFWKASVLKKTGMFDVALNRTMDYDFMVRLSKTVKKEKFHKVNVLIAGFRRHSKQKTQKLDEKVKIELLRIYEKNRIPFRKSFIGLLLKVLYKVRRMYWNIKIAGVELTFDVIKRYKNTKIL